MSGRRRPAASKRTRGALDVDALPGRDRPRDRHHGLDRGDTIGDVGATHPRLPWRIPQRAVGKGLELPAIEVSVRSQHARRRGAVFMKELDVARFVEPGVVDLRRGAAMFTVDLET